MAASKQIDDDATHRFAWDGISFHVPRDWNLSGYSLRRNVSWVRMEDDNTIRLEMEWTRSHRPLDMERVRKRFAAVSKSLTSAGAETHQVDDLPPLWAAFLYSMADGRRLLAAYRFEPGSNFFCFFKLHFESVSLREPPRLIRLIARTFQLHVQDVVPWELFDIGFQLNREFRLVATSFQAGRQLIIFEWRRRKLHLWFISLADMILKDKSMETWCADFLNGFKGIRGPRFSPGDRPGIISARRSRRYPLGQGEEIARWCFRYQAQCANLAAKNQLVLWVFQYREDSDLNRLMLQLGPAAMNVEQGG
ncbi:MAG: hypothetical protein PHW60_12870 [Kiritimatiellae bacterium]|nr:hypothetical protein [Kiritimatiellia bacterium]